MNRHHPGAEKKKSRKTREKWRVKEKSRKKKEKQHESRWQRWMTKNNPQNLNITSNKEKQHSFFHTGAKLSKCRTKCAHTNASRGKSCITMIRWALYRRAFYLIGDPVGCMNAERSSDGLNCCLSWGSMLPSIEKQEASLNIQGNQISPMLMGWPTMWHY